MTGGKMDYDMNYRQGRLMIGWLRSLQGLQAAQGTQALQRNVRALCARLARGDLPEEMQELRYDFALAAGMLAVGEALASCAGEQAALTLLRDTCAKTEAERPQPQYRCFGKLAKPADGPLPEQPDVVLYAGSGFRPGDVPDDWALQRAERITPYTVFIEDARQPLTDKDCAEPFFYRIWKIIGRGAAFRERMARFGYCDAQNVVLAEEIGTASLEAGLPGYLLAEMDADLTARAERICAVCAEEGT